MATKIHSITSAKVLSQLLHSFTHWITVAKISRLQPFNADTNFGLSLLIS